MKIIVERNSSNPNYPIVYVRDQSGERYDFIDLDELVKQIAAASLQKDITGTINLCSGVPVSLGDKINEFINRNNLSISLKYGAFPDRAYDSPVIYGDNTKIKAILNNRLSVF